MEVYTKYPPQHCRCWGWAIVGCPWASPTCMGKPCSCPCPPAPTWSNPTSVPEADAFSVGLCLLCPACAGDAPDTAAPCSVGNYLRWDLSAQQIGELTVELIEQTKRVYDQVGSQKFEDVSYESTLKALADVEVSYTGKSGSGSRQGGRSGSGLGAPGPWLWVRLPPPQGDGDGYRSCLGVKASARQEAARRAAGSPACPAAWPGGPSSHGLRHLRVQSRTACLRALLSRSRLPCQPRNRSHSLLLLSEQLNLAPFAFLLPPALWVA